MATKKTGTIPTPAKDLTIAPGQDSPAQVHSQEKITVGTLGTDIFLTCLIGVLSKPNLTPRLRIAALGDLKSIDDRWDMSGVEDEFSKLADLAREALDGPKKRRAKANAIEICRQIVADALWIRDMIMPVSSWQIACENATELGDVFGISSAECRFLALIHACESYGIVDGLMDALFREDRSTHAEILMGVLGMSEVEASRISNGKASIFDRWLVEYCPDSRSFTNIYEINHVVSDALRWRPDGDESITDCLIRKSGKSSLTLDNYSQIRDRVDIACQLLSGALKDQIRGVNILIHGPPGTGKTELSKVISSEVGATAYSIGEGSGTEDVDRDDRAHDLFMNEALLSSRGESGASLMIFDEMEDITVFKIGQGSKIVMNRFLEGNRVPIIWIANDLDSIPDYIIRRMMLTLEVSAPPAEAQRKILLDIASTHGINLRDADAIALQKSCDVIPAVARNSSLAASLTGGGAEHMAKIYLDVNSTLSRRKLNISKAKPETPYRPELSVSDVDIRTLADRVTAIGKKRVSFIFHGAPGTGKSAAARYIAERMGVKVIEKRGSDILGMYVGETEKAIRQAFEQAHDEEAALIFDEMDSLLSDRSSHQRGFETSQVNELLKCLEDHDMPVFGCTNLMDNLDQAAMRRFLFKVRFDVLDADRAIMCFEHYLDMSAPSSIQGLHGLVPSDFSVVKAQCEIMGIEDPSEMVRMLGQESSLRRGVSRPIGFTTR